MSEPGTRTDPPYLAFGREVRRLRSTLGLTLEQLAERSELTPNYIGSVENGRRDPSLSTVLALAKGLGVGAGELLGGRSDLGPQASEAACLLESLTPELQDAVLSLLRVLTRRRR
jgi:transcriptional regulator with XRE-family HTH domain